MSIEGLLREVTRDELEMLKTMGPGSNEHKMAVDDVTKLVDRIIEIEKIDIERQEKQKEMEDEQKDRFIKNCISVVTITVPAVLTIWGTLKSFEFEKEGTITTIMGRGFINKLLPKK